jgi:hypothetical protein
MTVRRTRATRASLRRGQARRVRHSDSGVRQRPDHWMLGTCMSGATRSSLRRVRHRRRRAAEARRLLDRRDACGQALTLGTLTVRKRPHEARATGATCASPQGRALAFEKGAPIARIWLRKSARGARHGPAAWNGMRVHPGSEYISEKNIARLSMVFWKDSGRTTQMLT